MQPEPGLAAARKRVDFARETVLDIDHETRRPSPRSSDPPSHGSSPIPGPSWSGPHSGRAASGRPTSSPSTSTTSRARGRGVERRLLPALDGHPSPRRRRGRHHQRGTVQRQRLRPRRRPLPPPRSRARVRRGRRRGDVARRGVSRAGQLPVRPPHDRIPYIAEGRHWLLTKRAFERLHLFSARHGRQVPTALGWRGPDGGGPTCDPTDRLLGASPRRRAPGRCNGPRVDAGSWRGRAQTAWTRCAHHVSRSVTTRCRGLACAKDISTSAPMMINMP